MRIKYKYHIFPDDLNDLLREAKKMYFSMKFNEIEGKTLNTRQIVRSFIRQF